MLALRHIALSLSLAVVSSGCTSTMRVENAPLAKYEPGAGYGAALEQTPLDGDLRIVLAFSGGGTRAAALAYGVLKELRDTEVVVEGERRRLLDAVTTISSVSGGSFTAAYYRLKGDQIFDDFEERFLRRNIDSRLAVNLVRPLKFLRLALTPYTRSDMAMDLYDKELFEGATFADLEKAGGPLLSINATDLDVGLVFSFMQPNFNLICSDLSQMRIAQAVTASSAVPGIFTPLRLKNFSGSCGFPEPEWIQEALGNPTQDRRRHHDARSAVTYLDAKARPNLFLVDGGVADNIGARRILANVSEAGGIRDFAEKEDLQLPKSALFIVVNSQAGGHHTWAQRAGSPSLATLLGAVSSVGIYRYNFETVELLRETTANWSAEGRKRGLDLQTYVSEVAFDNLEDPQEREFFNGVKTSFALDDETVDRLIEVGGRLLRESPDFQSFLSGLD